MADCSGWLKSDSKRDLLYTHAWPKIGKKAVLTERKDHLENKLDSGHVDYIYSTDYGYFFHDEGT